MDANYLLSYQELKNEGYRTFIPEAINLKKGFIQVSAEYSVSEIIENLEEG